MLHCKYKNNFKIAVISTWDNFFNKFIKKAWMSNVDYFNNIDYFKKYNYPYFIGNYASNKYPAWWKWERCIDILNNYDWVILLDADLIIMNHNIKFEKFIDNNYDIIFSNDYNGINTGVTFVKNTTWSLSFLQKVCSQGYDGYKNHPSSDQSAIAHLLYHEPKDKWKVISQKFFNSYLYENYPWIPFYEEGQYRQGDFILHLPAIDNNKREKIINDMLQKITI